MRGVIQRVFSHPLGQLLLVLYAAAVVILLYQRDLRGMGFGIGVSLISLGFAWAGFKLTEGRSVPIPEIPKPWLGLLLWIPSNFLWLWGDVQRIFPNVEIAGSGCSLSSL